MLFKGCPDSRLAGSILFLLCLFRSIVSNSCLAGTKAKMIFIFQPDHSNALPPSFSAHKKKKKKESDQKATDIIIQTYDDLDRGVWRDNSCHNICFEEIMYNTKMIRRLMNKEIQESPTRQCQTTSKIYAKESQRLEMSRIHIYSRH